MTGELTAPGAHAASEANQKSNVTVGPFPGKPGGHIFFSFLDRVQQSFTRGVEDGKDAVPRKA
jgi:hypothetical protein